MHHVDSFKCFLNAFWYTIAINFIVFICFGLYTGFEERWDRSGKGPLWNRQGGPGQVLKGGKMVCIIP